VLTRGGAEVWAICLGCDRSGGRSLSSGWRMVLGWFLWPILVLFGLLIVLYAAFG